MSEPDMTDDWMNPHERQSFIGYEPPKDKTEYRILRKKSVIVSGPSGSITQWAFWAKYDSAEERDAALERLRAEHPMWRLKAKDGNPYLESLGVTDAD